MPAKTKIEIGAEIESICTKCKIPSVHVITAIDDNTVTKVMCKICNSYHKPRFEEKLKKTKTAMTEKPSKHKKAASSSKSSEERKWSRLLKKVDEEKPLEYKMSESYQSDSVIDHPIFGLGVIVDVLSQKKIQVFFQDGEKTLVHNWE